MNHLLHQLIAEYLYDRLRSVWSDCTYHDAEFGNQADQDTYFKANTLAAGLLDLLTKGQWKVVHLGEGVHE